MSAAAGRYRTHGENQDQTFARAIESFLIKEGKARFILAPEGLPRLIGINLEGGASSEPQILINFGCKDVG